MTTPGKPVIAAGVLRYPQVMSPNFDLANPSASPANSWALLQSGLAYLFGVILTGGTIQGPDYVINPSGAFFYSGTPALGNLIASLTPSGGTDGEGNTYLAGATTYVPGVPTTATSLFGGVALLEAATPGGSFTDTLFSLFFNAGGAELSAPFICTAGTPSVPTLITTDTWNPASLDAGWTNSVASAAAVSYRLLPTGDVQLAGGAQFSSSIAVGSGQNLFTLPAGYRPVTEKRLTGYAGDLSVTIATSGAVQAFGANVASAFVFLDGITYTLGT